MIVFSHLFNFMNWYQIEIPLVAFASTPIFVTSANDPVPCLSFFLTVEDIIFADYLRVSCGQSSTMAAVIPFINIDEADSTSVHLSSWFHPREALIFAYTMLYQACFSDHKIAIDI
jgi:hypothetical protein